MNDDEREQLDEALTRLASGDRAAFDQAFALLAPVLTGFVRKAMPEDIDREDAAQNTLLRVFGRVSDYEPGTDALAWVLTLAAFEVATLRKRTVRQSARQVDSSALATVVAGDDVEGTALQREALVQLRAAVERLAPGDRHVLLSADAGPRPPSVRKRKQRALERLKQLWRALNGDD